MFAQLCCMALSQDIVTLMETLVHGGFFELKAS